MIKCTDKEKIIRYLESEDKIANLNIIGAIKNIDGKLFDNPDDCIEIFVDDLENPNGVVVREHVYWHYVYAKNENFIHLAKKEIFDKLAAYGIDAADELVYTILTENRKVEWEEPCVLLFVDPMNPPEYKGSLCLDEAKLSDTLVINDHYPFKDEYSSVFIEDNIKNRPSSVYRVNKEAVGWVLVHRDNSIGIMYIKEPFRKQGIAYELSMDIIQKVISNNQTPFIHVGVDNHPSFQLAEKCGFKKAKYVYWFGVVAE